MKLLHSIAFFSHFPLKSIQNKKDLSDVTAAPFSVSFSQLPAAKNNTENGAAVTSLRSFLFCKDFSTMHIHLFLAEGDGQTVEIPTTDENATKRELKEARIVKVTEENLDQFTIADVVMPIPGYKVSYPDHEELKKIYIELLQADGLEDGFESLKHSNEFYSLPGDYRSILVTPSDVSWKFTCYDDPNKDILVSDMALLEGQVPVVTGRIIYRTRAIITHS